SSPTLRSSDLAIRDQMDIDVRSQWIVVVRVGAKALTGRFQAPVLREEVSDVSAVERVFLWIESAVIVQPSVPAKNAKLPIALRAACRKGGTRGHKNGDECQNDASHGMPFLF